MQNELSRDSLLQFINNFTLGYLRRNMRSINPKRFVQSVPVHDKCEDKEICITELSTETFLNTVLDFRKVYIFYFF